MHYCSDEACFGLFLLVLAIDCSKIGSDKERVLLCLVNDRLVGLGQVLFQMKRVLFLLVVKIENIVMCDQV